MDHMASDNPRSYYAFPLKTVLVFAAVIWVWTLWIESFLPFMPNGLAVIAVLIVFTRMNIYQAEIVIGLSVVPPFAWGLFTDLRFAPPHGVGAAISLSMLCVGLLAAAHGTVTQRRLLRETQSAV